MECIDRESKDPYELELPPGLRSERWKVKIRKDERVEPPHATVIWKTERWRWGLRKRDFLEHTPDPKRVPDEVVQAVEENIEELCRMWDTRYPHNPVWSKEEDDE